jgi:environmental stress-induced protein Ves
VKIVRAGECRTTAWKNGRGSTTEIAVEPSGASLDDFDWRISIARVASDGPFSEFAGFDRTLAVVKGGGLSLSIGDAAPVVLDCSSEPIHFPGDTPTSARLLEGEIIDLNVMTKRDRFEHRLLRIRETTHCDFDGHDVALTVACAGCVELSFQQEKITLADGDTAILTRAGDAPFMIELAPSADCYLVLLRDSHNHAG